MRSNLPPLYLTASIRALEKIALQRDPNARLMERAGLAAAEFARELIGDTGRSILVLAGPGNNGGDAFEAATHLKHWFYRIDVVFAGDPSKLTRDAAAALAKWQAVDGRLLPAIPHARYDLVIDGLFGIGLTRAVDGAVADLIAAAARVQCPKLALDIASGINADTGVVMGTAFRATHTITFIAGKPGLHTLDGPDYCGGVRVASLGLDPPALLPPDGYLATAALLAAALIERPRNFHKGRAGSVAILGGASGMLGAALLAGRAALKLGAGKVFVGLLAEHPTNVDYNQPELMLRNAEELLHDVPLTAVAAGPGLGTGGAASNALASVLALDVPIVLDADALNLLAVDDGLQAAAIARRSATLLTPHPAECARLLGTNVPAVQADRIGAALRLAKKFHAFVAVKGNGTVIAEPDGHWWINTSGNPGMASGGMGDVLTGMAGALVAQGLPPAEALVASVYLHGAAADALAARGEGPIGLAAGELIDEARRLLNRPTIAN